MMMKKIRLSVLMICLATIIAILPFGEACAPKAQPGQVFKVGMMTPSTGPAADKGTPGEHGIFDAMKYINDELGGAGGYKIQVSWRDSAYDMSKVVTIVKDYMNEGCIMFTTHSSSEMKAAMGTANAAGFPGLAIFISTVNLHPPQHIYGPTPDYGDDWIAFTKYYMKNIWKGSGKPKMALHLLANPTGQGAKDGATAMAATLGIEIVDIEEHKISTISEIESLTRIKAKKADVLFISSTPAPTAVILKNAKELGMYPGITVGCAAASFTKALIDLAGADVVEGVYGVFHTVGWDDNVPGMAKATEYCKKYHPQDYGNMDYLSTWSTCLIVREILTQAVNNAGYDVLAKGNAESWQAIEKYGIQKLNGYKVDGLQGTVTYTAGDNRLGKSLKLYKISGGKIVPLGDWEAAPLVKYEDFSWWGK